MTTKTLPLIMDDQANETNGATPQALKSKPEGKLWFRRAAIVLSLLGVLVAAALFVWIGHTRETLALTQALRTIESGQLPDEDDAFKTAVARALGEAPIPLEPATYVHLSKHAGVTYNAALQLAKDGRYDYVLTVGTNRVHKLYSHKGRWWLQGRVLHTVLLEGDAFLTPPASRDRVTPARSLIVAAPATPDKLTLRATYGPEVLFTKDAAPAQADMEGGKK